jgi:hypothetical protein
MASWRILSKLALVLWSDSIYELIVSSLPCSGYYGLVSSILASICSDVLQALPAEEDQAKQRSWQGEKQQMQDDSSLS